MKEVHRITKLELMESKWDNLMPLLIGKNIINNPKVVRYDDSITGDIVFKEQPQCPPKKRNPNP